MTDHAKITLRTASPDDSELVWEWANDTNTRSNSFSTNFIPWETHQVWFKKKIHDPRCIFRIAVDLSGRPIGQIRCDLKGRDALVSVNISPALRGRGHGSEIIRLAALDLFKSTDIEVMHAYVKEDNQGSRRAFEKAGFKHRGSVLFGGHPALHLMLKKDGSNE
jgi:UDP-2,4-diacetamido-2,4,6-trideoxy-beta-L-altropyranose hydrolase